MTSNLATLHDLGDGLATLYTATIGRVGHEDAAELLAEIVDELDRLCDLTLSRLGLPQQRTGHGVDQPINRATTAVDQAAEVQAMHRAATTGARIGRNLCQVTNAVGWTDPALLVSSLLDVVLDAACECLVWAVTR